MDQSIVQALMARITALEADVSALNRKDVPLKGAWVAPTLLNGWVNFGAAQVAGYWLDALGVVHLRGLIKSGTVNTVIFTLPAGYRPTALSLFSVVSNTGAALVASRLDVATTGDVTLVTGGNTFLSLDGVSFRTS